jgi:hypothetical protein
VATRSRWWSCPGGDPGRAGGWVRPSRRDAAVGRIEESFRRRLELLPEDSQHLLQLAAADPVGDPVLVWRAAERLGIAEEAQASEEDDDEPPPAPSLGIHIERDHRTR